MFEDLEDYLDHHKVKIVEWCGRPSVIMAPNWSSRCSVYVLQPQISPSVSASSMVYIPCVLFSLISWLFQCWLAVITIYAIDSCRWNMVSPVRDLSWSHELLDPLYCSQYCSDVVSPIYYAKLVRDLRIIRKIFLRGGRSLIGFPCSDRDISRDITN